jgi:hypothetical protein
MNQLQILIQMHYLFVMISNFNQNYSCWFFGFRRWSPILCSFLYNLHYNLLRPPSVASNWKIILCGLTLSLKSIKIPHLFLYFLLWKMTFKNCIFKIPSICKRSQLRNFNSKVSFKDYHFPEKVSRRMYVREWVFFGVMSLKNI